MSYCHTPAVRQSDEFFCAARGCGLRWGIDEDRPPCPCYVHLEPLPYVSELAAAGAPMPGPVPDFEQQIAELRERLDTLETIIMEIRECRPLNMGEGR